MIATLSRLGLEHRDLEVFVFNFRAQIRRNNNLLLQRFR